MRDPERRDAVRLRSHAVPLALGTLVGLAGCGARSSTLAEDELPDCAAEKQRLNEDCRKQCTVPESPMHRKGTTSRDSMSRPDTAPTPCIEECIADVQKACEATATCRCPPSLTTLSGR